MDTATRADTAVIWLFSINAPVRGIILTVFSEATMIMDDFLRPVALVTYTLL